MALGQETLTHSRRPRLQNSSSGHAKPLIATRVARFLPVLDKSGPQSVTTTAIITLRTARPELTYQGIADELDIKIETVRKAIHRMRSRESPSSPSWVVDPEPAIAKEEHGILEGKPVQEELMSCPRRYRADYAKPKGWVDIPYMPILADGVTYESNYVVPIRRKPPIRSFNIKGPLPVNMRRVA